MDGIFGVLTEKTETRGEVNSTGDVTVISFVYLFTYL